MTLPTPSELAYFQTVSVVGNLSRSAERLGISQPTLSAAMQRLERALGQPLLNRHAHGVTLTPSGRELQARTRQLLAQWEQLTLRAEAVQNEACGRYTIGCHSSVALYTLPLVLPVLYRRHPKLDLVLKHGLSRHITEDVISRRVDLGIVVNPVRHPELVIRRIWRDEVSLWTAGSASSSTDTLIFHPDLLQTRAILLRLNKAKTLYPRQLPTPDLEVISSLVAAGVGIGVLPGLVAKRLPGQHLKRVPGAPSVQDQVCLIYRTEDKAVGALQSLVQGIMAATGPRDRS